MDVREQIRLRTREIEGIIGKYLPEESGLQKTVIEAMNYSFLAGGKRLRPMLMMETWRLFYGTGDKGESRGQAIYGVLGSESVEPFMAAIEMIHTYSLVHDDLPAMDDDDLRRGRPTTHVVYGEAMAILAGDGLLTFAFETALKAARISPGDPRVAEALRILAHNAGIYGMLGGQAADVESGGNAGDPDTLDFIYEKKTGALIEASMRIGAVLAGASEEECALISSAARDVGYAFQIRDDILDVAGTREVLGKPVGSDEKNGKKTYASLHGLEKAAADVEEISRRALDALDSLPVRNEFLNQLIAYLIGRER